MAMLMGADAQILELARSSADGKFVLQHLLVVVTWPASVAARLGSSAD